MGCTRVCTFNRDKSWIVCKYKLYISQTSYFYIHVQCSPIVSDTNFANCRYLHVHFRVLDNNGQHLALKSNWAFRAKFDIKLTLALFSSRTWKFEIYRLRPRKALIFVQNMMQRPSGCRTVSLVWMVLSRMSGQLALGQCSHYLPTWLTFCAFYTL